MPADDVKRMHYDPAPLGASATHTVGDLNRRSVARKPIAGRRVAVASALPCRLAAIPQRIQQIAVECAEFTVRSRLPALLADGCGLRLRLLALSEPVAVPGAALSLLLAEGASRPSRPFI